ncbi:hypothetical protein BDV11DRAFT_149187 [Aspergillus similis]
MPARCSVRATVGRRALEDLDESHAPRKKSGPSHGSHVLESTVATGVISILHRYARGVKSTGGLTVSTTDFAISSPSALRPGPRR